MDEFHDYQKKSPARLSGSRQGPSECGKATQALLEVQIRAVGRYFWMLGEWKFHPDENGVSTSRGLKS